MQRTCEEADIFKMKFFFNSSAHVYASISSYRGMIITAIPGTLHHIKPKLGTAFINTSSTFNNINAMQ